MKPKSVSRLKKKLDKLYSEHIRRKYSWKGYAFCITCGVKKRWQDLQLGHYIPRSYNSTRYLDENCHPQCPSCNIFKQGAKDAYALYLLKSYGKGILERLNKKKQEIKRFKVWELEELIEMYKSLRPTP